jgi:hypothetical protein
MSITFNRDEAISSAFGAIQGLPVDHNNTKHALPWVAGGARLPSLSQTTISSYLGAFFRVVGPLIERLSHMGGTIFARATILLEDPAATTNGGHGWATSVLFAHSAILELQPSFSPVELLTIGLIAPRGNIIQLAGDTKSIALDLPLR